jgi:hypothetical protein
LNSVAPSGGFAAGKGICASATRTTSTTAVHNPSTTARIAKSSPIHVKFNVRKL